VTMDIARVGDHTLFLHTMKCVAIGESGRAKQFASIVFSLTYREFIASPRTRPYRSPKLTARMRE